MNYLSVCSGIEAASSAWHPLGWTPLAFSEIEAFPSAVLAHHYPHVPNLGDMTKFHEWPNQFDGGRTPDCVVGGTPCQAFSIAGLREGLKDPRGNLTLTFLGVVAKYLPEWVVWENVPGVLSSITTEHPPEMAAPDDLQEGEERECVEDYEADSSHALSCFLDGLQKLGYGCALRCHDAQYAGLAQRRRRVFVVGYLGDWRRAAEVLFEPDCLCWNPPPSREAGQKTAGTLSARTEGGGGLGTDFDLAGGLQAEAGADTGSRVLTAEIAPTLNAHFGEKQGLEDQHINGGGGCSSPPEISHCLNAGGMGRLDYETETLLPMRRGGFFDDTAHTLRATGFDASENGTGRGTPLVPCAIQAGALRENPASGPDGVGVRDDGVAYTLEARAEVQAVAFDLMNQVCSNISHTLRRGDGAGHESIPTVAFNWNAQADQLNFDPNTTPALTCSQGAAVGPVGSIAIRGRSDGSSLEARYDGTSNAILTPSGGRGGIGVGAIHFNMAVRRLTPKECERLQGFPDDHTNIPVGPKKKPAADGPRYKAIGNSMAVTCMAWIGRRIAMVRAKYPRVMEVDFE